MTDAALVPGGRCELGSGLLAWQPLLAEQDMHIVMGPQGGYHFIVQARIAEMAPGDPATPGQAQNPSTTFSCFRADGKQIDKRYPPYRLGYGQSAAGWFELSSGRILQIDNGEIPALYGTRVRIALEVRDSVGHQAKDERSVRVVAPPAPPTTVDAGQPDAL